MTPPAATPETRPAARRGFTLVDLTVAVLIMGILSAVAVPRYADTLASYRVEAAAKRVIADLEVARRRAVAASASQTVPFVPESSSYSVPGMMDPSRPSQAYGVELAESPFYTTLVSATFGGTSTATFDGYGLPLSGGTIVLRAGEQERTVILNADTGEASTP